MMIVSPEIFGYLVHIEMEIAASNVSQSYIFEGRGYSLALEIEVRLVDVLRPVRVGMSMCLCIIWRNNYCRAPILPLTMLTWHAQRSTQMEALLLYRTALGQGRPDDWDSSSWRTSSPTGGYQAIKDGIEMATMFISCFICLPLLIRIAQKLSVGSELVRCSICT